MPTVCIVEIVSPTPSGIFQWLEIPFEIFPMIGKIPHPSGSVIVTVTRPSTIRSFPESTGRLTGQPKSFSRRRNPASCSSCDFYRGLNRTSTSWLTSQSREEGSPRRRRASRCSRSSSACRRSAGMAHPREKDPSRGARHKRQRSEYPPIFLLPHAAASP